jgi:uncharacterized membrane protein
LSIPPPRFAPSPHRLDALADGVFAIVLTLLALELRLPETAEADGFWAVFVANAHVLENFVIAFFVVGVLWRLHHLVNDQLPRGTPYIHALTLGFLASVTLTPWSLDNLTSFTKDPEAVMAFSGILLVSWSLLIGMLSAALSLDLEDKQAASIRRTRYALLSGPLVALLSVLLAYVSPTIALYVWLLLVPVGIIARRLPYAPRQTDED